MWISQVFIILQTLLITNCYSTQTLDRPIKVLVVDKAFIPTSTQTHKVHRTQTISNDYHSAATIYTLTNHPNKLCKNVEIVLCGETNTFTSKQVAECVNKAVREKIKFVLIPLEGTKHSSIYEKMAFERASRAGTLIVVSAGNSALDLDKVVRYPQNFSRHYSNVKVVSAYDLTSASRSSWTINNFSGKVWFLDRFIYGTSFSAPKYLNTLLNNECRRISK